MKKIEYLIIGAGISGLSCAKKINNKNYIILEKEKSIGGYCKTFYIDDYVWDYAGHFFHFNSPEVQNEFSDLLNHQDTVYNEKITKIYYKNQYVNYPFQYNIHELEKEEFIDCLVDLFARKTDKIDNFKEMLYTKFGKAISEKFLIPYNSKLYACDLNLLDKDAMGRFFPYAEPEEIICGFRKQQKKTYNNAFFYSKKGAQAFVDKIAEDVDCEKIKYEVKIKRIDLENRVVYTENEVYEYVYLINTIPFPEFLALCNIPTKTECTANKVLVFNMGFDKESIDKEIQWIYYPEKEYCFYRVGFYNNILHDKKLSIYVEIGLQNDADVDIEEYKKRVLNDLKKVGVITNHNLMAYNSLIMSPAYVHIQEKNNMEKESIMRYINSQNAYSLGRYGAWTYCSIEDCIIQAYSLMRDLKKETK